MKIKHISILKHNLLRAAMTLALMMTCAMAWAQSFNFTDDGNDTYTIHNAAGIVCSQYGEVIIRNCRSSINIHSGCSGDGTPHRRE